MTRVRIALLVLLAPAAGAAQERPIPNDSSRITIAGCAHDRAFVVATPEGRESRESGIQAGRRFRLEGSRVVLNDIRRREATMVEITGLVRKSDLNGPGGWKIFGGRVRIGGALPRDPVRDPVRDPMYNQTVIDVEGFQLLPDPCPLR